jgi:hypothetical protein
MAPALYLRRIHMGALSPNPVDVAVLAIIVAVVALIVHGMVRGTIRTCDSGGCAGECGSCGHTCSKPRIRLSDAQRAELAAIDRRAEEARHS